MSDEVKKGRGVTYVDLAVLPDMLRKGLFLPDTFEIAEVKYASHDRLDTLFGKYVHSCCPRQ